MLFELVQGDVVVDGVFGDFVSVVLFEQVGGGGQFVVKCFVVGYVQEGGDLVY